MSIPILWDLAGRFALVCSLVLLLRPQPSDAHLTLKNVTITVPNSTTNHGDSHLLCPPTRWSDIAVFFFGNYFAHAATVKSKPGESAVVTMVAMVFALLYPASGVVRGLNAIIQRAILCKSPLKAACRAEALCTVVRGRDWKPRNGETVRGLRIPERSVARPDTPRTKRKSPIFSNTLPPSVQGSRRLVLQVSDLPPGWRFRPSVGMLSLGGRKIHGKCILPPGYDLAVLPSAAAVDDIGARQMADVQMPKGSVISEYLSCSYSFSKALVAIIQTVFASITLYRTRGDQIQHYGYAAFGLTVAPYLIMSIVNLIGTMVTPDYPAVYMVRSDIMDEASTPERKGYFEGVVGSTESSYILGADESFDAIFEETPDGRTFMRRARSSGEVGHRLMDEDEALEVYAETNEEDIQEIKLIVPPGPEIPERVGMIAALLYGAICIGCIAIAIIGGLSHFKAEKSTKAQRVWTMTWLAFGLSVGANLTRYEAAWLGRAEFYIYLAFGILYCAPAIGGFAVVGQMLQSYGNCIRIY